MGLQALASLQRGKRDKVQGLKIMMTVLQLFFESLNINMHATLGQVPIKFMQRVLVALQYEEASSYNILIKYHFCHFILWVPLAWMPGTSPRLPPSQDFNVLRRRQGRKCYASTIVRMIINITQSSASEMLVLLRLVTVAHIGARTVLNLDTFACTFEFSSVFLTGISKYQQSIIWRFLVLTFFAWYLWNIGYILCSSERWNWKMKITAFPFRPKNDF